MAGHRFFPCLEIQRDQDHEAGHGKDKENDDMCEERQGLNPRFPGNIPNSTKSRQGRKA
jgi:hypothetical protein